MKFRKKKKNNKQNNNIIGSGLNYVNVVLPLGRHIYIHAITLLPYSYMGDSPKMLLAEMDILTCVQIYTFSCVSLAFATEGNVTLICDVKVFVVM